MKQLPSAAGSCRHIQITEHVQVKSICGAILTRKTGGASRVINICAKSEHYTCFAVKLPFQQLDLTCAPMMLWSCSSEISSPLITKGGFLLGKRGEGGRITM
jgi:hypothetical protein